MVRKDRKERATLMTPNTGDMVITHTVKPSTFNRLTELATGSQAHHVQTMRDPCTHFSNQPPHAVDIPHIRMVADALAGVRVFAVYRWYKWASMPSNYPDYVEYRTAVRGAIYMADTLKIKYDWLGPVSLAWNALRKHIPGLRNSKRFLNSYRKFFCSEGAAQYQLAAGIDLASYLPPQPTHDDGVPYLAPVHFARFARAGLLRLVEDHGLHELIA